MRLAHLTAALTLIAATTLSAAPARADVSAGFSVPLVAGDGDAGVAFVMQGHGLLQTEGEFRAEAAARTSVGTWVLGWGPSGSGGVETVASASDGLHVRADFEVMGLTLYEEDLGADPNVVVDLGTFYPIPNGLQIGVAFGPVFFGIEGNVGVAATGVMFTDLDWAQETMTATGGLNVGGVGYAAFCIDLILIEAGIRCSLKFGTTGIFTNLDMGPSGVDGAMVLAITPVDLALELYIRFGVSIFSWEQSLELFGWGSDPNIIGQLNF